MKVSIVVPCYQEEQNIHDFYRALKNALVNEKFEYEIVFVDDGSKDKTLDIIKQLCQYDSGVIYTSFSRNFGKEAAMLAGLTYSVGDAVVIMDADLQHPPSLIPLMITEYLKGYDQVIARRTRTGEKLGRTVFSRLYYKMINHLVDVQLDDGAGDFRLLSRRAVDALLQLREYNRFSKGLFSWIGFKETVIDYDNVLRPGGKSRWSFSMLLNYGLDGVLSFNNRPLRLSIYLGFVVTLFALVYVIFSFINSLLNGIDTPGYFTLISSVLLIGGFQLIFLGVIGEYIGRIYYETKNRPHYLIKEDNIKSYLKENVEYLDGYRRNN